jgi:hypothetical protein
MANAAAMVFLIITQGPFGLSGLSPDSARIADHAVSQTASTSIANALPPAGLVGLRQRFAYPTRSSWTASAIEQATADRLGADTKSFGHAPQPNRNHALFDQLAVLLDRQADSMTQLDL